MADISFNIARKELKIAQIAQLYQLFRLSHLFHIYGHGFCELSRMLMRKNVNNDVSKDSPIHCNSTMQVEHNYHFSISFIKHPINWAYWICDRGCMLIICPYNWSHPWWIVYNKHPLIRTCGLRTSWHKFGTLIPKNITTHLAKQHQPGSCTWITVKLS